MAARQLPHISDPGNNVDGGGSGPSLGYDQQTHGSLARPYSEEDQNSSGAFTDSFAGGQLLPQINSARGERMNADHWREQTKSIRDTARDIRLAIGFEAESSDRKDTIGPSPRPANMTQLEERLKKRTQREERIREKFALQYGAMKDIISKVGRMNEKVGRVAGNVWIALNIAEKRLEIRTKLPPEERVQDNLQDALEAELKEVAEVHKVCDHWVQAREGVAKALEEALGEMDQNKLTIHANRTDFPWKFLERMQARENEGQQFCDTITPILRRIESILDHARDRTNQALKARLAELQRIRNQLYADLQNNEGAVAQAEVRIERWEKQMRLRENRPEDDLSDATIDFDEFWKTAQLSFEQFRRIQAAIKGASYTGSSGRQLDVLFKRADKNGSGELDQDEFKTVLRRLLKIPKNVISDPEVAAFCDSLDKDGSGSVSIAEICVFLYADLDIERVKNQHATMKGMVDQLHLIHDKLVNDSQRKREAWLIDRACSQVNAAQALELDTHLDKNDQGQQGKRRKPLDPRVVNKVRAKLQKLVQGKDLEEIFNKYDRDGTGHLSEKELLRALRKSLGVPTYSISDAEVSSLCAMLDDDASGSISISELALFIGADSSNPPSARSIGSAAGLDSPRKQRRMPGQESDGSEFSTTAGSNFPY